MVMFGHHSSIFHPATWSTGYASLFWKKKKKQKQKKTKNLLWLSVKKHKQRADA